MRIAPLKPGDGVVFDAADWRSPQEPEEGGRVFEVAVREGRLELRFGNGAIDAGSASAAAIWFGARTIRISIKRCALFERRHAGPQAAVRGAGDGARRCAAGSRMARRAKSRVTVRSPEPLGQPRNRALDTEFLQEQFGRLGNTPYELSAIELGRGRLAVRAQFAVEPVAARGGGAACRTSQAASDILRSA